MKLIEPSNEYIESIRAFRAELLNCGSSMDGTGSLRRTEDPAEWIKNSAEWKFPENIPEGRVPATQFMYVNEDGKVVGMLQIRHYFNEELKKYGGHVGYCILPSERRKGYAKAMLKAALPECRKIGLDRIMISCYPENEGSRKTILANGGIYDSTVYWEEREVYLERYWIDLFPETAGLRFISLSEMPELEDAAAEWFHSKWGVPQEVYLECMDAFLSGDTVYGWYLCLDGERIVGGMGVIENDFHDRKDLYPNVCAVYTEEDHRRRGISGRLLSTVVSDMRSKGVSPLYLLTDHTGFYERYGWEFYCPAQGDGEEEPSRLYVHR